MDHLLDFFTEDVIANEVICIQDKSYKLTYNDFKKKVFFLAYILQEQGIVKGDRVGLYLSRGIDALVAVYAILLINAIYVPLNIKDPESRVNYILEDVKAKLLIFREEKTPKFLNLKYLNLKHIIQPMNLNDISNMRNLEGSENFSAILYTSGSTGRPKGVILSHRAMVTFVEWAGSTFKINSGDNIASLAPLSFDLSIFDIFTSLRYGASLFFIPDELTMSPAELTDWLATNKITIWYTVPSMLSFWAERGKIEHKKLPQLRTILFAGEVISIKTLQKLVALLPNVRFYNLYGPTETNVCAYWEVDKHRLNNISAIPIGFPACNSKLKIDTKENQLMVKGSTLMSGYWKSEPIFPDDWYATGDQVEQNELGEYLFKGRLDNMIKYFGYRIEPGEIESAINQITAVHTCKVVSINDKAGKSILAAFLVMHKKISIKNIKRMIESKLPKYMIPSLYYVGTEIPKLNNGKSDLLKIKKILEHWYENEYIW